jgi:formamidopyrimidine-DNA glycosylase
MPELPEVETVCRGLTQVLEGRRLIRVDVRRPDLRIPFPPGFAESLVGRRVDAVRRRAKYWQWFLDDGMVVLGHLGMSGTFAVQPPGSNRPPPGPHDHVVIETDDGSIAVYRDPRRFGLMTVTAAETLDAHPLMASIGPEPLSPDFDGSVLAAALKGRKGPIKPALLDQTVVAGVGNIYACEALFRAGISPRRSAGTVTGGRAVKLAKAIQEVLTEAIASGGSSLRDHKLVNGELGYFQHSFGVYDQEGKPCPGCGCEVARTGGVARLVQAGRSTFFCPRQQR